MQSKYSNSMCLVVHVTEDWRWWVTILPFSSSVQFSGKRNLSISTWWSINDQFSGSYYNVQPAKFKNFCLHFILPPPIEPREITDILQTFFFFFVCTVSYGASYFLLGFMAGTLCAWAINPIRKNWSITFGAYFKLS